MYRHITHMHVTMRVAFCVPAHICNSHTCDDHLTCEYFVGQYSTCVSANDVTYMYMYHGPMQLSLEDDLKEKMATIQELTSAR